MFVYLTAAQVEFDGEEGDGESDPGTPHHNNTPGALTALSGGSVVSSAVQPQRHLTPPHRMTPGEATASTGSQLVIAITTEDTKTSSRGNVFILKIIMPLSAPHLSLFPSFSFVITVLALFKMCVV